MTLVSFYVGVRFPLTSNEKKNHENFDVASATRLKCEYDPSKHPVHLGHLQLPQALRVEIVMFVVCTPAPAPASSAPVVVRSH